MKKICLVVIASFLLSSVAFASPLMDYSQGKGSIDLTWRNTQNTTSDNNGSLDWNKKYNLDGGLTLGLGNNFAFQYRNFEPQSADFSGTADITGYGTVSGSVNTKFETNEFNILYKLDKGVAAFAGFVTAKGSLNLSRSSEPLAVSSVSAPSVESRDISSSSKNMWQLGLIGVTPIATNVNLYGLVGAGNDWTNFEAGISYEFAPSFEFDVNYRDIEAKKFNLAGYNIDGTAKGLGFGITYTF